MVDQATVVAIAGIVVSGVVGPWVAAVVSRKSSRQQFERDQAARRRDELRSVLDEAAVLLGAGATHVRHLHESAVEDEATHQAREWFAQLFPLGQRLRLRLPTDHPVVVTFDAVRSQLIELTKAESDPGAESALERYEQARSDFLVASATALSAPFETHGVGD